MNEYYGTIQEALEYHENRLHSRWLRISVSDRPKALIAATRLIDALNYKGCKHTVWELLEANPDAEPEAIRAAELEQPLEFPRGSDTEVPLVIRQACYEIAHALGMKKDPELELENLMISSQGYESVRTTYNRTNVPIEHVLNLIPSALAWEWIRPFLRDEDTVRLSRV